MLSRLRGMFLILLCCSGSAVAGSAADLVDALHQGNHVRLATLLRQGASPNERLADGSLPLAWAVDRQDVASVRLLLQHGAWVDDPVADGNPFRPLFVACLHPHSQIIALLLEAGADVNVRGTDEVPALSPCGARAPAAIVAAMLEQGALADVADKFGQTPLMWAAQHGREQTFDLLIAAGADLRRVSAGGFTATMFAVKSGHSGIAHAALAAGGDRNRRAPDGSSLVQLAMFQGNYGIAQTLIKEGADVQAYDLNGRQLLHAAALARQPELVALLLAAGAEVDARTKPSQIQWRFESNFKAGGYEFPISSALLLAAREGDVASMTQLIAAGADVTAQDSEGYTLLLSAASSGVTQALQLALAHSPEVDVTTNQGDTALHRVLASAQGSRLREMLGLLSARGARTDIANAAGKTAMDIVAGEHFKGRPAFVANFPKVPVP